MTYKNEYFEYSRNEMLGFIPAHAKTALEIGCGAGAFASALVTKGIECWGIEPETRAYQIAKDRMFKCFNGEYQEVFESLPKGHFDAIIFNDVLEHLSDPWKALESAKILLSANGSITASIPNILYFNDFLRFLLHKDFQYTIGGTFDKTHLRFFTKKSIVRLFHECGYEITKMEGIHPYRSMKLSAFNLATFGYFNEMKYLQFAVQAKVKK